jgi:hypothetical protein
MPSTRTLAPASRACAATAGPLLFRICEGPGTAPTSTSSSPVTSTATTGRRETRTRALPVVASTPTAAGSIRRPRSSTRSPARTSDPRGATFCRSSTGASIVTLNSSSGRVFSTCCTAVAPFGSGAPVMIFAAWPGPTVSVGESPARTSPISSSAHGACATSAARSA